MGINTQRNCDHILSFGYIADNFEVLWAFSANPGQAQRILYSYNIFMRYCMQSDWLRTSRAIIQELGLL